MPSWVPLVAYLLGFGLLQLVVWRYFREELSEAEQAPMVGVESARPRTDGGSRAVSDDTVVCDQCGTPNERDPAYTFCRQCTTPLQ